MEQDESESTATPGIDYKDKNGTLTFNTGETEKTIDIEIIQHEKIDELRDETFGLKLLNITPAGAKLSKKDFILIHITTDADDHKKQEALA